MLYRIFFVTWLLTGCASQSEPYQPGKDNKSLVGLCPASPNCVSTSTTSSIHQIDAPILATAPEQAWPAVIATVKSLPRTIITYQDNYHLRAESRSRLFRFIDDIEIYLDTENNQLAMRSASRLGYSDLGVNGRRLHALIDQLRVQGIVK